MHWHCQLLAAVLLCAPGLGAGVPYSYASHGTEWNAGQCSSRLRQSPINFDVLAAEPQDNFWYQYATVNSPVKLENDGKSLWINFDGQGYGGVRVGSKWYNLIRMRLHSMSEHTFRGKHAPLELHLIHKEPHGDGLVGVAVPFVSPGHKLDKHPFKLGSALVQKRVRVHKGLRGQAPDDMLSLSSYAPPPKGAPGFNAALQSLLLSEAPPVKQAVQLNFTAQEGLNFNLMLGSEHFLQYAGSLTVPPCTEKTLWMVKREPLEASDAQIDALKDALFKLSDNNGNHRSVMPLNSRVVTTVTAVGGTSHAPFVPNPTVNPNFLDPTEFKNYARWAGWHTDFKAIQHAKDAFTIAKAVSDYTRDLDYRLRNSAKAHAASLKGLGAPLPATTTPFPIDLSKLDEKVRANWIAADVARAVRDATADAIDDAKKQMRTEISTATKRQAAAAAAAAAAPGPAPAPGGATTVAVGATTGAATTGAATTGAATTGAATTAAPVAATTGAATTGAATVAATTVAGATAAPTTAAP